MRLARSFLGERAAAVSFLRVGGTAIPLAARSCAGMFSCHVFQHLSGFGAIASYLRETHRVLAPGGTVCFHVPVAGAHRGAHIRGLTLAARNAAVTLRRFLGARRLMEYHRYTPRRMFRLLDAVGFRDLELRIFDMTANGDAHSFFFARKP